MKRTRLKSELLATLRLGAGDTLAVVDVLAALVALPERTGKRGDVDRSRAPDNHGN